MMPGQNPTTNTSATEQTLKRPNTVDFEQLLKGMKHQPSTPSQPGISAPSTPSSLHTAGSGQNAVDLDKQGKELDAAVADLAMQDSAAAAATQQAPGAPASSLPQKTVTDDEDFEMVEDYAQGLQCCVCVHVHLHVHAYGKRYV